MSRDEVVRIEKGVFYSSLVLVFFCSSRKYHGPAKQALQPHSLHLHRHIGPTAPPTPLPPLQVQPGQIPCCRARAAGPAQPHWLCWQPQAGTIPRGGTTQVTSHCLPTSPRSFLLQGKAHAPNPECLHLSHPGASLLQPRSQCGYSLEPKVLTLCCLVKLILLWSP